jgi:hypothetical protein
MAVIGDSVAWGQGLKSWNKFSCRTKHWLEAKTGRPVEAKIYAHAGAVIDREQADQWEKKHLEHGNIKPGHEVNVSFPTIISQVETAENELTKSGKVVDLVLLDGCINDVKKETIINAKLGVEGIRKEARTRCGQPFKELLAKVGRAFPQAEVIVTGYFPLVFKGVPGVQKGTAHNLLMDYLIKYISGEKGIPENCKDDIRGGLDPMSQAWVDESSRLFSEAVRDANAEYHTDRFAFVETGIAPEFGFSTPNSMLWTLQMQATHLGGIRKGLAILLDIFDSYDTNDETWKERKKQCKDIKQYLKSERKRLHDKLPNDEKDFSSFTCNRGSLAHPNQFGAAIYAQAITDRLAQRLSRFKTNP